MPEIFRRISERKSNQRRSWANKKQKTSITRLNQYLFINEARSFVAGSAMPKREQGSFMGKILEKDLLDLNEALYELIWMPNKADANPLAARLRHKVHNLEYVDFKEREKLFEAISCAEGAAGDARRKEYWIRQFEAVWVPLENALMNKIASSFVTQSEAKALTRAREVKEIEV